MKEGDSYRWNRRRERTMREREQQKHDRRQAKREKERLKKDREEMRRRERSEKRKKQEMIAKYGLTEKEKEEEKQQRGRKKKSPRDRYDRFIRPFVVSFDPKDHVKVPQPLMMHNPHELAMFRSIIGIRRFPRRITTKRKKKMRRRRRKGGKKPQSMRKALRGMHRFLKLKKTFIDWSVAGTKKLSQRYRWRRHRWVNTLNPNIHPARIPGGTLNKRVYPKWFPYTITPQVVHMRRPFRFKRPYREWMDPDIFQTKTDPGLQWAADMHHYWVDIRLAPWIKARELPPQEQPLYNRYDAIEQSHMDELVAIHLEKTRGFGLPTNLGYIPGEPTPPLRPTISSGPYPWQPQRITIPYPPIFFDWPEMVMEDPTTLLKFRKLTEIGLTGGTPRILRSAYDKNAGYRFHGEHEDRNSLDLLSLSSSQYPSVTTSPPLTFQLSAYLSSALKSTSSFIADFFKPQLPRH